MAGRRMRWALAIELLIYAGLSFWLQSLGWLPDDTDNLAIALFLGLRVAIVLMSYGFVLAASSPVPADLRIGPFGWLRMVLEEYVGRVLLFCVIQPFERVFAGADRLRPSPGKAPLLLLHGYQCNRGFWFWLRRRLDAAGWVVATHNLEPDCTDIDNYAEGVERRINEVLAATGAKQVILIGHSMGGLVSRAYLRRYGASKVAQLITLGSPHHGSRIAALAWGENGRQMRIGNPWLKTLAAVPLPARTTSIYSVHDNQVMPQQACSELSGARNLPISGVSHLGMAFSPKVLRCVMAELG